MKKTLTLIPILLLGFVVFSQDFSAKHIQKNLVEVRENLYVWPYEVSNGLYNEFLADLKAQGVEGFEVHAVKAEGWENVLTYSKPYVEYYHSHEAYTDYPVVNITQTDAERFCVWFTEKYKEDPKHKFRKAVFRLPTLNEWEQIASSGDSNKMYPWGHGYIRNNHGQFLMNCTRMPVPCMKYSNEGCYVVDTACRDKLWHSEVAGGLDDRLLLMAPVQSFFPTRNGLFNLSGNVAEMVSEGVAKGGSWHSLPYYCQIWTDPEFTDNRQPSPMVGFRFVMEVVEQ